MNSGQDEKQRLLDEVEVRRVSKGLYQNRNDRINDYSSRISRLAAQTDELFKPLPNHEVKIKTIPKSPNKQCCCTIS